MMELNYTKNGDYLIPDIQFIQSLLQCLQSSVNRMQPADQIHTAQERNHDSRRHDTYDHLLQPLYSSPPIIRRCLLEFSCHKYFYVSLPISKSFLPSDKTSVTV